MSKWGSVRISGAERIVMFHMTSIPLYLDGRKVRKVFSAFLGLPSSLMKMIRSDLSNLLTLEKETTKLIYSTLSFLVVIFGSLFLLIFLFIILILAIIRA